MGLWNLINNNDKKKKQKIEYAKKREEVVYEYETIKVKGIIKRQDKWRKNGSTHGKQYFETYVQVENTSKVCIFGQEEIYYGFVKGETIHLKKKLKKHPETMQVVDVGYFLDYGED